eukprot:COSAG01_NODE_1201_length_11274_cov_639.212349_11_plen_377_part_00
MTPCTPAVFCWADIDFMKLEELGRQKMIDATEEAAPTNHSEVTTRRRVLAQVKAVEIMVPDDLSSLNETACAVVMRFDGFTVANSDYEQTPRSQGGGYSPRSADTAAATSNAQKHGGWDSVLGHTPRSPRSTPSDSPFAGSDGWDSDSGILLGGLMRNVQLFCCHRDNHSLDKHGILQPVTANTALRFSTEAPKSYRGEWVAAEIDIELIELDINQESLRVLLKVMAAVTEATKARKVGAKAIFQNVRIPGSARAAAGITAEVAQEPIEPVRMQRQPSQDAEIAAQQNPAAVYHARPDEPVLLRANIHVETSRLSIHTRPENLAPSPSGRSKADIQMEVLCVYCIALRNCRCRCRCHCHDCVPQFTSTAKLRLWIK